MGEVRLGIKMIPIAIRYSTLPKILFGTFKRNKIAVYKICEFLATMSVEPEVFYVNRR